MATKNTKIFPLLFAILIAVSCSEKKSDNAVYYNLASCPSEVLTPQVICDFDNLFPTAVELIDSFAVAIQRGNDAAVIVINANSGQIITEIGMVGHGPDDVINPEFITNIHKRQDGYLYFEDTNSKKLFKINFRNNNNYAFEKLIDYPQAICPSSNLNYTQNVVAGRKIETNGDKMFYIYHLDSDSIIEIDYSPIIENFTNNRNYFYASNLALNAEKNTVFAGMYFFDIVQLFDLFGNSKRIIHFSQNSIPKINAKMQTLDLSEGYNGTGSIYSTKDYCYLKRLEVKPLFTDQEVIEECKNSIIKMDWEGTIVKCYQINEELIGGFCVDEETKKIYAIRHRVDDDLSEYYGIVSYSID